MDGDEWLSKLMAVDELLGKGGLVDYSILACYFYCCAVDGSKTRKKIMIHVHNKYAAVRIMEVRLAYMQHDFEWDNLKACSIKDTEAANLRVIRRHASKKFAGLLNQASDGDGGEYFVNQWCLMGCAVQIYLMDAVFYVSGTSNTRMAKGNIFCVNRRRLNENHTVFGAYFILQTYKPSNLTYHHGTKSTNSVFHLRWGV